MSRHHHKAPESKKINVVRYSNRKYYCMEESGYIVYEDIQEYIKQGFDVKVTCKVSGADITHPTLLAIIKQNEEAAQSQPIPMGLMSRLVKNVLTPYAKSLEVKVAQ